MEKLTAAVKPLATSGVIKQWLQTSAGSRPRRCGSTVVLWPPPGQSSELVVRFAVTEFHVWWGVGGALSSVRRQLCPPRHIAGEASMPLSTSGPDHLLHPGDCRRLIREMAKRTLAKELDYIKLKDWDKAVPRGVEARVAELVSARRRGGCTCEVFMDVYVSIVLGYCEADALLAACILPGRRDNGLGAGHLDGGGDGAAPPPCAICFEEMAEEAEATRLPGCSHVFHRGCISMWFEKASTCPVCRRDKIQFLPPDYMAVHDMMLSDHEG